MMAERFELVGQRFGRMVVVERASNNARNNTTWICRCDCGTVKRIIGACLVNDTTKSCGCHRREVLRAGRALLLKHGHATGGLSRTYHSWQSMVARCHNPKHDNFKHYGAKGITVCAKWRHDFAAFLADVGERPEGRTIDRIENSRGYEPDNVRWATSSEQQSNRSVTKRFYDVNDVTITAQQIAAQLAMPLHAVYYRFSFGR